MSRDFVEEYGSLIMETIIGGRIRGLLFGYDSQRLRDYLESQRAKMDDVHDLAFDSGYRVFTSKNLELSSILFGLEVKVTQARFNAF